jgi:hypothetical protein
MNRLERHLRAFGDVPAGPALPRVLATVWRDDARLHFRLALAGAELALPPAAAGTERRDELWRTTCAELFLAAEDGAGYLEWNLSPSGHWNLYRFDGYRSGGRREPTVTDAAPRVTRAAGACVLEGTLPLAPLGLAGVPLVLGPAAVVAGAGGVLTYWALAHPAARPDFHDRRGFTLRLAPVAAAAGPEG